MRVAVLSDYQRVALDMADWDPVRARAEVVVFSEPFADGAERAAALADFDVVCAMREREPFPADVLERLPRLRCLVTTGSSNRSIDVEAANRLGVTVSATTNGLARVATAELTWALVLAAARHLTAQERALRDGGWQTTVGRALQGRTLGILGLGGVGRWVARYGAAFGMTVLAHSPSLTTARASASGASAVSFGELLTHSDVLSVHVAMSSATVGVIDAAALARMKPTAVLVNTSRGPVVDEAALVDALQRGVIEAAALDVFDQEPLPAHHPYLAVPPRRLVLSPHIGYVTEEVYRAFYAETVESVLAYLDGAPIRTLAA